MPNGRLLWFLQHIGQSIRGRLDLTPHSPCFLQPPNKIFLNLSRETSLEFQKFPCNWLLPLRRRSFHSPPRHCPPLVVTISAACAWRHALLQRLGTTNSPRATDRPFGILRLAALSIFARVPLSSFYL